ncbi:MAG: hypothetical protein A2788_01995 [Candidatus Abawacabacteria bacterium RIFCSPHIGHO2_01_FULL_46_8]|uniref:Probable endolytic peptidoglycan transglycosylase RlpA n=1 Tax=Candidatus Abawacabacteria bacterium RIFCSPHIGHO2_01_FULL_46_8 TaxID=1817815 RepID=A0A1F4XKR5_9BACT|nr:MAG: hypothetical protein A2788_01995 [Candidatus Abawacabacteria bacterium RIFCSPHIGHO2_01_FULL_46_8]
MRVEVIFHMSVQPSFWRKYRIVFIIVFLILLFLILFFGFAKPVAGVKQFSLIDGNVRIAGETRALTIGQALREMGIELAYADEVVPEATENLMAGMELRLRRSTPVLVKGPSGQARIFTKAKTVAGLLEEIGYQLSQQWQVRPAPEQEIKRNLEVQLIAMTQEEQELKRQLSYSRRYRSNKELPFGQENVIQEGQTGERLERYLISYENGKEIGRKLLAAETITPKQDLIIEQGVKVVAGQSLGKIKASYYADFFHGRRTANGETFYNDRLSAAHLKLPFGTVVKVTNPVNGQSIIVAINDRGPYIAGRSIDLSQAAFAAIAPLSRGVIPVELEIVSQGAGIGYNGSISIMTF